MIDWLGAGVDVCNGRGLTVTASQTVMVRDESGYECNSATVENNISP